MQAQDKINGNDFVAIIVLVRIRFNTRRRHQIMFNAFFELQDPMILLPRREKYPNWKVCPVIQWMNYIFPTAWLLGIALCINQMTMGFQGRHVDKRRITTYKTEGDGFQCNTLAQQGYCYQFYMQNDLPPKKHSTLSPSHARVMALYNTR